MNGLILLTYQNLNQHHSDNNHNNNVISDNNVYITLCGDSIMTLPIDREVNTTKDKTDKNINTYSDKDCSADVALGIEYSCYSMSWHTNGSKSYSVDSQYDFRNGNNNDSDSDNPKWLEETFNTHWNYFDADIGSQTGYKNKSANLTLNAKTMIMYQMD